MGLSSTKDDILISLRNYTALLQARNNALVQISRTSEEMCMALKNNPNPDISEMLNQREEQCTQLAALFQGGGGYDTIVETAKQAMQSCGAEASNMARAVLALHADSQTLAEKIITCQNECEDILKKRLEATASAIRESVHRRKLDAAYGPACKHDNMPMFLDKQR